MNAWRIAGWLGAVSVMTLASFVACSGSSSSTGTSGSDASSGSSSGTASSSGGSSGGSTSSGSSSGGASSSGSSSGGGSGSGGGADGGSSGGGDSGSDGPAAALPYVGGLGAAIRKNGATTVYGVSGGFFPAPDAGTSGCAGTMSGSCCYLMGTSSGGGLGTPASAGTITVKSGASTLATVKPGTGGVYDVTSTTDPTLKWTPGDTLTVSGAGAVVDAFSGNIVTVVDFAALNPTVGTGTVKIAESAAFSVTWTAGPANSKVALTLAVASGPAAGAAISCIVQDSAGKVTVDKTLLAKIGGAATGTIGLQRTSIDTVTVGNALIELTSNTTVNGAAAFTP